MTEKIIFYVFLVFSDKPLKIPLGKKKKTKERKQKKTEYGEITQNIKLPMIDEFGNEYFVEYAQDYEEDR
jgi:hypothetical protein